MVEYVLGVAFDFSGEVVLVIKSRPEWQKGLYNFPGGKINSGESPAKAMSREYLEEVGMYIPPESWEHFATLQEEGKFKVYCFRCQDYLVECVPTKAQEIEPVVSFKCEDLAKKVRFGGKAIENVAWLLYLALDTLERRDVVTINYSDKPCQNLNASPS